MNKNDRIFEMMNL